MAGLRAHRMAPAVVYTGRSLWCSTGDARRYAITSRQRLNSNICIPCNDGIGSLVSNPCSLTVYAVNDSKCLAKSVLQPEVMRRYSSTLRPNVQIQGVRKGTVKSQLLVETQVCSMPH